MNFDDWQRLCAIVADDVKAWDYPDGIKARRVRLVLQIGRRLA